MSKEKDPSSRFNKPKFVYLDKFRRYQINTDKMLGDLEKTQMKHEKHINKLQIALKATQDALTISLIIGGIATITAVMAVIY